MPADVASLRASSARTTAAPTSAGISGSLHGDEELRGELLQLGGIAERRFVVEHLQELRNDLPLQNLGLDFGDVRGRYRSVGAVSVRTRACPTVISAQSGRGWKAESCRRPEGRPVLFQSGVAKRHLTAARLRARRDVWFGTISCVLVIRGGLDQGPRADDARARLPALGLGIIGTRRSALKPEQDAAYASSKN
jgi:hypothetical protein